ncbi:hypothetical protein LGQ02_04300 [Bacillus shivajii]|uniref:hypothetical protein n=1 Tax=Bacillus shivajii TaxID=1983719 RepID=UPI001CFC147C|nr:hypothetical protein [Bacillus shivajii]UCZ54011.1 hypothetical protein LGQ02_04300 [Bacillus shivajii]
MPVTKEEVRKMIDELNDGQLEAVYEYLQGIIDTEMFERIKDDEDKIHEKDYYTEKDSVSIHDDVAHRDRANQR